MDPGESYGWFFGESLSTLIVRPDEAMGTFWACCDYRTFVAKVGQGGYPWPMTTVNIGKAKTDLSRLINLALAGEEVEIAKDGVPAVRLVPVTTVSPGKRFLAAGGSLSGLILIGDDFELTDNELDEILGA